jgi:hypothetical protein
MVAQAIATFFAALVLTKSLDDFRRRHEPWPVFLFWISVWLAVLIIAFFPGITFWLRDHIFGPQAGIGTILGIAIIFLLYLSYRIYLKADRTERAVNKIVSELALQELLVEPKNK